MFRDGILKQITLETLKFGVGAGADIVNTASDCARWHFLLIAELRRSDA
jgi:hypothetical protein